jgi:hypothetical protein
MKYKYKVIILDSEKKFKQAERLQANGWTISQFGYNSVICQKEVQ